MRQLRALLAPEPGDPFPVRLSRPDSHVVASALSTGRIVSYDYLQTLTGATVETIRLQVFRLRKKGMRIRTVQGVGYQSDGWDDAGTGSL